MALIEWELPKSLRGRGKMKADEVSLYSAKSNYCLTFNQELTKLFIEKGTLLLSIGIEEKTGELSFIVNKDHGLPLKKTGSGKNFNLKISNKEWIGRLHQALGLQIGKRYILNISGNTSMKEDRLTYKLIKVNG